MSIPIDSNTDTPAFDITKEAESVTDGKDERVKETEKLKKELKDRIEYEYEPDTKDKKIASSPFVKKEHRFSKTRRDSHRA